MGVETFDRDNNGMLVREVDGVQVKTSGTFFRGDTTNFHPNNTRINRMKNALDSAAKGWMPSAPFIGPETNLVAFGSCFAANISNHLNSIGYSVATKQDKTAYISNMGDGIVNTFAILQQFDWAWENRTPATDLWHGYDAQEFGYDENVRLATKAIFDKAEVFIITLGLSEIWYDEPTGEVFWRSVPTNKFDPTRHKFRVSTFAENYRNIERMRELIRQYNPGASIILTLSPIPLAATFRDVGCVSANSSSKAILRAVLDEFMRQTDDPKLFYFPSYEVIMDLFQAKFGPDRRHPFSEIIHFNLMLFERYFCQSGVTDERLEKAFNGAKNIERRIAAMTPEELSTFQKQREVERGARS